MFKDTNYYLTHAKSDLFYSNKHSLLHVSILYKEKKGEI